jgi:phage shock protein C
MKRLYRSRSNRKIAGIFGGLEEIYEIDANILRLLAILLLLISGFFPVLVTYIVAWVLLPDGKPPDQPDSEKKAPKRPTRKKTPSSRKKT